MREATLRLDDVAAFVQPTPRRYNRISVILREAYELLVMSWLPGQASVPHDHAGSICVFKVLAGEAAEGCYQIGGDGYVDLQFETPLHCGDLLAGQDAGVHSVRNSTQTGQILVTIHVYAPPLKDFRQFSERPQTRTAVVPTRNPVPTMVIVGGGFSGSMAAAQALQQASRTGARTKVVLTERRGAIGEGVAFGTREAMHLLNVPAGRMSAWPDSPENFVQWATRRYGQVQPTDFLPRLWYGEYIRESLLTTAQDARPSGELVVIFDEVRRVARHPGGGWMVHLGREPSVRADAVVLAIGHRPPSDPIGRRWNGPRTRFIADPWRPFAMNVVKPEEPVVILGSGLTAVDSVLSLTQQPRQATITLVSRNGLLPQTHAAAPVAPADLVSMVSEMFTAPGGVRALTLLRNLRHKVRELSSAGQDWRSAVDGLRPHTAALWRAMSAAERQRFLSRLRPFWEMHRHRMAWSVAQQFHTLLNTGAVRLLAGRVESTNADADGVQLVIRERTTDRLIATQAVWVVNCTGPMASNNVESNPVIGSLLVNGLLRPDELGLGIDTTLDGNPIAADGQIVPDLFIVGTLCKPAFWESTAVPELRIQAATVATRALSLLAQQRLKWDQSAGDLILPYQRAA
jgi:uncharacterized NAD(P)/FAD-binding protein YdhS